MQSAAGDQTAANAVDGFIPKSRPTNAPKPRALPSSKRKQPASKQVSFKLPNSASVQSTGEDTSASVKQTERAEPTGPAHWEDSQCTPSSQAQEAEQPFDRFKTTGQQPAQSTEKYQELSERQGVSTPQQPACIESQAETEAEALDGTGQGQSHGVSREQYQTSGPPVLAPEAAEPAEAPVLSFEIEDADGPLEGAANSLASQFGCFKVRQFANYRKRL